MSNGSLRAAAWHLLAGLALLAGLGGAARAQTQSAKPADCNSYTLDEKENRIVFNDPRITVQIPSKKERDRLRSQGTPGQVFLMQNCDAPDTVGDITVYSSPGDAGADPAKVPSAVRVIILAEQDDWVQVKGHTSYWKGTGWIKRSDKILIVKY